MKGIRNLSSHTVDLDGWDVQMQFWMCLYLMVNWFDLTSFFLCQSLHLNSLYWLKCICMPSNLCCTFVRNVPTIAPQSTFMTSQTSSLCAFLSSSHFKTRLHYFWEVPSLAEKKKNYGRAARLSVLMGSQSALGGGALAQRDPSWRSPPAGSTAALGGVVKRGSSLGTKSLKSLDAWVPNTSSSFRFIRANLRKRRKVLGSDVPAATASFKTKQSLLYSVECMHAYLPLVKRSRNFQYEGLRFWTSITAWKHKNNEIHLPEPAAQTQKEKHKRKTLENPFGHC